jgi:hypothetical protein
MLSFSNSYKAVRDMHERGYTDDFELRDAEIFWVQEKMLLNQDELAVLEYFRIHQDSLARNDIVILGVCLSSQGVKGILMHRFTNLPFAGEVRQLIKMDNSNLTH